MQKIVTFFLLLTFIFTMPSFGQNISKVEESNYGATIERNLEAHTLLERAKGFLESKKYQDAVLILKFIVEKFPNILISDENKFYVPFKDKIFEIINGLPEDAKKMFLLEINSISNGLYKKAMEEMNFLLLEEIDSKYFLSEYGDDAANQLGIFAFEKGNFIKAIQYFEKALLHPQCSLNKEKLKLSLYYLYSVTGKKNDLVKLELLKKNPSLKEDIDRIDKAVIEFLTLERNAKNTNRLFDSKGKLFWTTIWYQKIEGVIKSYNDNVRFQRQKPRRGNRRNEEYLESFIDEENIYNEWKKNLWYPANNSFINDNVFILRSNDLLICYSLDNSPKIVWETNIESSNKKRYIDNYYDNGPISDSSTRIPSTREEILAFSDQIGKLMVEIKGVLYAISNHENTGNIEPFTQKRWGAVNTNLKMEGNFIFAIDIKSGKKMWKLGDNTNKNDPFYNAIFLHLPIETPYGLFVTFQINNDVFSAMITPKREIVWKKYLCSAESTNEMPLNNAAVVLGDDYLFITIDYGVIIKINAINGNYSWVKRYGANLNTNPNYYSIPSIKEGIEINSILYHMGYLVILPSDQSSIIVLNSETGEELFKIDDGFVEYRRYLIGADSTGFYLAGSKGVRKYAYNNKKMIWQSEIKENFGKGVLSGNAILFPSNQNIYIIDTNSGKKLSMLTLNLNKPNVPIGNIIANGSFLVSTSFDSVYVLNEVDLIINNLTASIASNKTADLLHRRGMLYFEKGDIDKSFEDFNEAIKLCEFDMIKRNTYCESLLDVFEKLYEKGLNKKYKNSMENISKYLVDGNQKSYWFYLQGEISLEAKNNSDALKNYIMSFSQPNGELKPRLIKDGERNITSGFAALLKTISLAEKNLITEDELIVALNSSNVVPEEFILLAMLEKFQSINFKKWVFKNYLAKIDQKFDSSKIKSFLYCLSNSNDPNIRLSAKYYLFLQNMYLKEYWNAGVALQVLLKLNPEAVIYTTNGLEKISELVSKYNVKDESVSDIYNPSISQITAPPLKELWRSSKILNSRSAVVNTSGSSTRPEYVEKSIFIHNRTDKKLYSCDILTGDIKWSLDLANEFGEMKNDENLKPALIYMRMEGVGLLNYFQKDVAIDLLTGKVLWSLPNDKAETLDMGSGCVIRYKPNELTVIDAFSGKKMYSLTMKEDIKKVFAYRGRLLILNNSSTVFFLYNLYTGELLKETSFSYTLLNNFNLLLSDKIIFQKNENEIIAYSLKDGQIAWSQPGTALGGNYLFNINDKNILMYSQNGFVYYMSGEDGKEIWSYEIKERYKYRAIDLCPVSGNESLLIHCATHIIRNNSESNAEDNYFVIDMANGKLLHEVNLKSNNQEIGVQQYAWKVAFKSEVFPKIVANQNNTSTVKFIKIKDGDIVKKHYIEITSRNENEAVFAKGHVLFVFSGSEIFAYGNQEIIEDQKLKVKILAEALDDKK